MSCMSLERSPMGRDYDAQLAFGIRFKDQDFPWIDKMWGSWLEEWWKEQGEEGAAPPIEMTELHGDGYPECILAVPGTVVQASKSEPRELARSFMDIQKGEIEALIRFCDKYGLWPKEGPKPVPKWHLSVRWF